MQNFSLECVPDMLIGKLLQTGIIADSVSINHTVNQELCLFVRIHISRGTLQEHLPHLVLITGRAVAELCLAYPQLHGLIVHVLAPAEGRWGKSQTIFIQRTTLSAWHTGGLSDTAFVNTIVTATDPAHIRAGAWRSPMRATTTLQPVYQYAYHLDRVPRILMGKAQTLGLSLDAAHIHRDQDGYLVLYAEFPIDEQTDVLKDQHILSIVQCAGEFVQAFPELQRLAIWTRPEYDDKVAISSFWIARPLILAWSTGEVSDAQLLAACHDYNP